MLIPEKRKRQKISIYAWSIILATPVLKPKLAGFENLRALMI